MSRQIFFKYSPKTMRRITVWPCVLHVHKIYRQSIQVTDGTGLFYKHAITTPVVQPMMQNELTLTKTACCEGVLLCAKMSKMSKVSRVCRQNLIG